jgi:hypothetical protein
MFFLFALEVQEQYLADLPGVGSGLARTTCRGRTRSKPAACSAPVPRPRSWTPRPRPPLRRPGSGSALDGAAVLHGAGTGRVACTIPRSLTKVGRLGLCNTHKIID